MKLFFPRISGFHKSLDDYDHSSVSHLLESMLPGDNVTLFHRHYKASHTMIKLHTTTSMNSNLWKVSWHDEFEEPCEQATLAQELFSDVFASEDSLWLCVDGGDFSSKVACTFNLWRASEFNALPQPRPSVQGVSLLNGAGPEVFSESEESDSEVGGSEVGESNADDSEQSDFDPQAQQFNKAWMHRWSKHGLAGRRG